jgi:hypothetical protein
MNPKQWVRQACQRAGRNMSLDEWATYFFEQEYRKTCTQWPEYE